VSFLGTALPPTLVCLILRRLTDELRTMATRDPLTSLMNRRSLMDDLEAHFRQRDIGYPHLRSWTSIASSRSTIPRATRPAT
jgi:hypothetical protein